MHLPVRFVIFLLVAACLCLPAAAEQKPDAAIKTKAIDASVKIDPALKAYRGLYPRLLAAGKREMAKWRGYAEKSYREDRNSFNNGLGYEFDRSYQERSVIQGYVSIVRADWTYSAGAAHPNTDLNTLLWDAKAGKFISIRPFFNETATNGPTMRVLAKAIRAAVVAEKTARKIPADEANDPTWLDSIKPNLLKIGAVALAPSTEPDKSSGLLVYFSPYAVGPYVEGSYTVFVPWTAFKTHVSRTGAALFSGNRPKADEKNG